MIWVDAIGFLGTGLTIATYAMRSMVALRVAALMSNGAFLANGLLIASYPIVLMEVALLPLNAVRLYERLWGSTSVAAESRSGRS